MAAESGKPGFDLTEDVIGEVMEMLHEEPFVFSFFQAVRLLQRFDSKRKPVGEFAHPSGGGSLRKPSIIGVPRE